MKRSTAACLPASSERSSLRPRAVIAKVRRLPALTGADFARLRELADLQRPARLAQHQQDPHLEQGELRDAGVSEIHPSDRPHHLLQEQQQLPSGLPPFRRLRRLDHRASFRWCPVDPSDTPKRRAA
jgi:hypothetical protein